MKRKKLNGFLALLFLGALTLGQTARGQETGPPTNEFTKSDKENFQKVTKRLDPYGNFYLYMNTQNAVKSLDQTIDSLSKMMTATMKNQNPQNAAQADMAIKVAMKFYKECGLRDMGGIGLTSVQTGKHFYRNKAFLYHPPQKNQGKIWKVMGKKPHKFAALSLMPKNTVAAMFSDFDMGMLWDWHLELVKGTENPQLMQMYMQRLEGLKQMAPIEELIKSTDAEFGMLIAMDPNKPVTIPQENGQIKFSEPGVGVFIKTKDTKLRDFIFKKMADGPKKLPYQEADIAGVKVRTYNLPLPVPMEVSLNFATIDGYLVLASSKSLMTSIINTSKGKEGGLAKTAEFQKLAKGLKLEGNMLQYVSPRLKDELAFIQDLVVAGVEKEEKEIGDLLKGLIEQEKDIPFFSLAVARMENDGMLIESNTSVNGSTVLLMQTAIAPAAIMAGMMLPVLSKAREKARRVNCAGNLKQIGLGLLMYSGDNRGMFPENLAVLAEKDYLNAGKVYLCPSAKNATEPKNAKDIRAGKISYLYFGNGLRDDNAKATKTVIACDKPGNHGGKWMNFLFIDGHVEGSAISSLEEAVKKGYIIPGVGGGDPEKL